MRPTSTSTLVVFAHCLHCWLLLSAGQDWITKLGRGEERVMQVKADQKGLSAGLRASIKGKVSDQLSKAEESELADVSLAHGSVALRGLLLAGRFA